MLVAVMFMVVDARRRFLVFCATAPPGPALWPVMVLGIFAPPTTATVGSSQGKSKDTGKGGGGGKGWGQGEGEGKGGSIETSSKSHSPWSAGTFPPVGTRRVMELCFAPCPTGANMLSVASFATTGCDGTAVQMEVDGGGRGGGVERQRRRGRIGAVRHIITVV